MLWTEKGCCSWVPVEGVWDFEVSIIVSIVVSNDDASALECDEKNVSMSRADIDE